MVFSALGICAGAVRITDVKLSNDPVDFQGKFTVTAKLSGPTCNMLAEFYVDREDGTYYRFDYQNVGCDTDTITAKFDLSAEEWEAKKISCGTRKALVELHVLTGNAMVANKSVDFDVGSIPNVEFSPSEPMAEKSTRVTLTDKTTGNAIYNANVKIKDIYGGDSIDAKTDQGGSFAFTPRVSGEFKMSIRQRDVCGDLTFYAKRPLMIDGPRPDNPVINEMVIVAVPSGASVGVKILDAKGDLYRTVPVSFNGGANFSISEPGTYILSVGDQSTKYWGINKTFTVSDRLIPEIKVAPDQPTIGKPATITVSSRGSPLDTATVTVKKPDGVDRDFATTSYGTVNYDMITSTGIYNIRAIKDRYGAGTASFEARNSLDAKFEPQMPNVKDTITINVKDQNDKPVSDVLVDIPAISFKRVTDMGGKLSFNLQEAKEYEIKLTKDLYWDKTIKLTPYGLLVIGECVKEFELGGSLPITVFDSFKSPAQADINVKDPDGIVKFYSGASQTLTPDKPGQYSVSVTKTNYIESNITFNVLPHPLNATSSMSKGQLTVNVTSKGAILPGVKVSVKEGLITLNGTTNNAGQASFNINKEGNITVTVNPGRENKNYEERAMRQQIVRSYDLVLLATPLSIIFLITLFTIIAIQIGRKFLGGGEWKMPQIGGGKPQMKTKHDSVLLGDQKPKKSRLSKL
jgi:hypothetical protein